MAEKNGKLTVKYLSRMKSKWKKMKRNGAYSKIGQKIVGMKIGKFLKITKALYDRALSPPLWFEIKTKDGFKFAMNSKNLLSLLKRKEK